MKINYTITESGRTVLFSVKPVNLEMKIILIMVEDTANQAVCI